VVVFAACYKVSVLEHFVHYVSYFWFLLCFLLRFICLVVFCFNYVQLLLLLFFNLCLLMNFLKNSMFLGDGG